MDVSHYIKTAVLASLVLVFLVVLSGCGGTGASSTYIISEGSEEEGVAWALPRNAPR